MPASLAEGQYLIRLHRPAGAKASYLGVVAGKVQVVQSDHADKWTITAGEDSNYLIAYFSNSKLLKDTGTYYDLVDSAEATKSTSWVDLEQAQSPDYHQITNSDTKHHLLIPYGVAKDTWSFIAVA